MLTADPRRLDDLATALDARARQMWSMAVGLHATIRRTTWEGPAADRFRSEAESWVVALERDADELNMLAAQARRSAAALRQELMVLGGIEQRVSGFFWRATHSATPPLWTTWLWRPGHLPPTGSPAWRDVQQYLRVRGVAI